jgi:fibronectin type 3 domain-containing protein
MFGSSSGVVGADAELAAPPPIPTDITATDGAYVTRVEINWAASSGATYYDVYRATHDASNWTWLFLASSAPASDYTAVPGALYDYSVRACSASECSERSSADLGYRRLSPPENVTASDGSFTNRVQITWTAASQAHYYRVYRATSAGGTKSDLGSCTDPSFLDTTAIPGTDYYYWVKTFGVNQSYPNNTSDYSAYDTGYRRILAPSSVSATDGTWSDKVVVTWSAVWGATSYKVYRGNNDGSHNIEWWDITNNYYYDTTATPGTTYYYWVAACDSHPPCTDGTGPDAGWRAVATATATATPTGTRTNTPTLTRTPTQTTTAVGTATRTSTTAGTPTLTRTPTQTTTAVGTATWTSTIAGRPTSTITATADPTRTLGPRPTGTATHVPAMSHWLRLPLILR